ncbi:Protein of unknown function (DUF1203) [Hoeflea sp. IMCC20628]|uniref:DUF1203 domain-containing protein n=1 Tax=Hoeflea sp. IMCC20628 TaxID=1620421 RepID=UPI00063AFF6C|nr:DUF1203 domain-containing protein [Hoeflea sp. IMCC20628]AKI00451.1 Protein of unknown function (DUF1203) [Hoeflea sp. IMCC20628]
MHIRFEPMDTATAKHLRSGGADSNGNVPEYKISDGASIPCRCCMKLVGKGEPYLIAAWRPFTATHAYAETGPVFLHAEACTADPVGTDQLPAFLQNPDYILRGYDADERIVYGTGGVIKLEAIPARIAELLEQPAVTAVHIRSSRNNCYHCRAVPDELAAAD